MKTNGLRKIVWMLPALAFAVGCGEPPRPDACENVTCGTNATCSNGVCACNDGFAGDPDKMCSATDAPSCQGVVCGLNAECQLGDCLCKPGFEGDPDEGCTPVAACTETSCSGHGECAIEGGKVSCTCEPGYAGNACSKCATGYMRDANGVCVQSDLCGALSCTENSECVITDGKAACECTDGWAGDKCDECADGYAMIGLECVSEQIVSCTDVAPDNATSTIVDVTVTYDPETGWTRPAVCEWTCDEDYDDWNEQGACINEREVACVADAALLPENATFVEGDVTIRFTTENGWEDAAACGWACNDGFRKAADGLSCVPAVSVTQCTLLTSELAGMSDETYVVEGQVVIDNGDATDVFVEACYTTAGGAPVCGARDVETMGDLVLVETSFPAGVHHFYLRASGDGYAWVDCGLNGSPIGGDDERGVATIEATAADFVEWVRNAAGSSGEFPVKGAVVTAVVPDAGDGLKRFYVQAAETGPALYVELAASVDASARVGGIVDFTATQVERLANGVVAVTDLVDFDMATLAEFPMEFFQNIEGVRNFASKLDAYESELVEFKGVLVGEVVEEGKDVVFTIKVKDSGENLTVRVTPEIETDDYARASYETAVAYQCEIASRLVMSRNGATPEGLFFADDESVLQFEPTDYDCAMPFELSDVVREDSRTVVVEFSGEIDPASITDFATQFVFVPALEVKSIEVEDTFVVLRTAPQADVEYTLTVSGVADARGYTLNSRLNSATFEGSGPKASDGTSALVISQVYGGGGNSGATYTHDFIELFNRSDETVYLDGLSLQYASATSDAWSKVVVLAGTVAPGGFFLVAGASSAEVGEPLPAVELEDPGLNIAATAGKVILVDGVVKIDNANCPVGDDIIDFVGFGSTMNCKESLPDSSLPSNLSSKKSVSRKSLCLDEEAPFVVDTTLVGAAATPASGQNKPRNSASAPVSCFP